MKDLTPARITPRLGLDLPRYHLRLGRVVHAAAELQLFRVQTTLLLSNDLTGETELHLSPDTLDPAPAVEAAQRQAAAAPAQHGSQLVVELPGWRDAAGRSPFWEAFGARFFKGDPAAAEAQLGPAWRTHLAALLPRQLVYLSFLGEAAEACAGRVRADAEPLVQALSALGFEPSGQLRLDDGGPVMRRRL